MARTPQSKRSPQGRTVGPVEGQQGAGMALWCFWAVAKKSAVGVAKGTHIKRTLAGGLT